MPLFDYRCRKGHTREVLVRAGDDEPGRCETCGGAMQRQISAPAKAKVRGGKRRKDIRYRKKGEKLNLNRGGGK